MADEAALPPEPPGPPDPSTAPESPRKRRGLRRLIKVLLIAPLVLILLVVIAAMLVRALVTPDSIREKIVAAATESLGVPVTIRSLDYHPLTGVRIEGIRVGAPDGFARDVFTADAVEVRYSLEKVFARHISVHNVALTKPRVVLETHAGRTNVDAILAHLAKDRAEEPPPEPSKPMDRSGPLSPVSVALERVALEDIAVEMVGDGPNVVLEGVTVQLAALLDQEQLRAALEVRSSATSPRAGEAAGRLKVRIPAAPDGSPPLAVDAGLDLALTTSVAVDTDLGATVRAFHFGLGLGLDDLTIETALPGAGGELTRVPPADVRFSVGFGADTRRDRAGLEELALDLNRSRLVDVTVDLNGLHDLARDALGNDALAPLLPLLGLKDQGGGGVIRAELRSLRLPLDELAPYVALVMPDAAISGLVALGPVVVSGTLPELKGQTPRELGVALGFSKVHAELPSNGATLGSLDGKIEIRAKKGSGEALPIQANGELAVKDAAFGPNAVGGLALRLSAGADRADYPSTGATFAKIEVDLDRVAAPSAQLPSARIRLSLEGKDAFSSARDPAAEPVKTRLVFESDAIRAGAGANAIAVSGLAVALEAALDRLLEPARKPIALGLKTTVRSIRAGKKATVDSLGVDLDVDIADPRGSEPVIADSKLGVRIGRVRAEGATLQNAKLDLKARAGGMRLIAGAGGAPAPNPMPENVRARVALSLPSITLKDGSEEISTSSSFEADLRAHPRAGGAVIESLTLAVADVMTLRAWGSARRVMSASPEIDLNLKLEPIDLGKAITKIPRGMLKGAPGLAASGKVGLTAHIAGTKPAANAPISLIDLPLSGEIKLELSDVGASLPANQIALDKLAGAITVTIDRGKVWLDTGITLGELAVLDPKQRIDIGGLALDFDAGFKDRAWLMKTLLTADKIGAPGQVTKDVKGTRFEIDVAHTPFGDVDVRRVYLTLPSAGVDASFKGRLAKKSFGTYRPELALELRADLDKARGSLAQLKGTGGRVVAELAVSSPREDVLDVNGVLAMDRVSYEAGELAVRRATGRVPFDQRVYIPKPRESWEGAGAAGGAGAQGGQEIEALQILVSRLKDLQVDLQERSKIYVDPGNVLVDSPRSADYEALRPYASQSGARVEIEEIAYGKQTIRALSADALYRSGLLRLDRFAMQVWEGDVFAELAIQIADHDNARVRMRGTVTDLNSDMPSAVVLGRPVVKDPGEKALYRVSGNIDLKLDLRERSIGGALDISMSPAAMVRIIDAIDPMKQDGPLQENKAQIQFAASTQCVLDGTVPAGIRAWINQSLLNVDFVFSRSLWGCGKYGAAFYAEAPLMPIRGTLFLLSKVTEMLGQELSITGLVPPIRRRPLAEVFEKPAVKGMLGFMAPMRGKIISGTPDASGQLEARKR